MYFSTDYVCLLAAPQLEMGEQASMAHRTHGWWSMAHLISAWWIHQKQPAKRWNGMKKLLVKLCCIYTANVGWEIGVISKYEGTTHTITPNNKTRPLAVNLLACKPNTIQEWRFQQAGEDIKEACKLLNSK